MVVCPNRSGFRRSGRLRLAQGLLPRLELPVRLVFCDAVALLQPPRKILAVPGNIFQVIVGQLGPLLTGGSLDLLPLTFDLVPIHTSPRGSYVHEPDQCELVTIDVVTATVPIQITPGEVKQRLDAGEKVRLLDVREMFEYRQAHIEGSELIPMRSVRQALPSFEAQDAPLIVFCHHGMRSLQVVNWLREQGIERCSSMEGGIDRWS